MLVSVLREGPAELHGPAATALSYIADPNAVPSLISQAQTDRGPTRHEVVRALGASLRNKPDPTARKTLRTLADDANLKVAVAAIAGLAAAQQLDDAPALRAIVEKSAADRRRAAAWALGELQDTGAIPTLADVLSVKDDRLVGDAAWALGQIAVSQPTHPRAKSLVERWLYLGKHGGWAAAINGTGALARFMWALPRDQRVASPALTALAFHKSRLVRINAALALSSLSGDDAAAKTLMQLLEKDASPHVRIAAAHGLARIAAGANKDLGVRIAAALGNAARGESETVVREAAAAAQQGAPQLPARTEWRTFQVIDRSADDAPVRQEPYFVQGSDDVVWAAYTDARGELNSEHIAPNTDQAQVHPASREAEY